MSPTKRGFYPILLNRHTAEKRLIYALAHGWTLQNQHLNWRVMYMMFNSNDNERSINWLSRMTWQYKRLKFTTRRWWLPCAVVNDDGTWKPQRSRMRFRAFWLFGRFSIGDHRKSHKLPERLTFYVGGARRVAVQWIRIDSDTVRMQRPQRATHISLILFPLSFTSPSTWYVCLVSAQNGHTVCTSCLTHQKILLLY